MIRLHYITPGQVRLRPATEGLGRGKQGSNKAKSKKEKVKRKNKKNLETRDPASLSFAGTSSEVIKHKVKK